MQQDVLHGATLISERTARLPCPGRRTTAARSARGAPVESPVVELDIGLLLDSRSQRLALGRDGGAIRSEARRSAVL